MAKSYWFLIALFSAVLLLTPSVNALRINEIMYYPSGSLGGSNAEWIEVYNADSSALNLTDWKIADPSNHTITGDDLIVSSGGYLIISKSAFFDNFSAYYSLPADAKAGFSLNNAGEKIDLMDPAGAIVDSVTFDPAWGANGNNNSLQLKDGEWCEGSPTPGIANTCSPPQEPEENPPSDESIPPPSPPPFCNGTDSVRIISYPQSMKFGESAEIQVKFNSTCYNFSSALFIAYGSSSRVVSYENGSKISSYASCQNGISFESPEKKDYSWEIPLFSYPNCDSYYEEDNYSISLRACTPSGEKYHEEGFQISFSGKNSSKCSSFSDNSSDSDEEASSDNASSSGEASSQSQAAAMATKIAKINTTSSDEKGKDAKASGDAADEGGAGAASYGGNKGVKMVAIYLTGILAMLLAAYLIRGGKI